MPDERDICFNCFQKWEPGKPCPHCGFDADTYSKPSDALPIFTRLNDRYMVGRVIGRGGFGITYVALDTMAPERGTRCAIKEYLPQAYAARTAGTKKVRSKNDNPVTVRTFLHCRQKFVEEGEYLSRFERDPNAVQYIAGFEENNTAYIVMELLIGRTMQQVLREQNKLELSAALKCFMLLGTTLAEMHRQNILHRDIKPNNIFFTDAGEYKLIDFGAARDYMDAQQNNDGMSVLFTTGYTPPEQYIRTGDQGTWSDVYSLCATCYTMISGIRLGDSRDNKKIQSLEELGLAPREISDIFLKGMEKDRRHRYQTFDEILSDLSAAMHIETKEPAPQETGGDGPGPDEDTPSPGKKEIPERKDSGDLTAEPKRGGFFRRLFLGDGSKQKNASSVDVDVVASDKKPPERSARAPVVRDRPGRQEVSRGRVPRIGERPVPRRYDGAAGRETPVVLRDPPKSPPVVAAAGGRTPRQPQERPVQRPTRGEAGRERGRLPRQHPAPGPMAGRGPVVLPGDDAGQKGYLEIDGPISRAELIIEPARKSPPRVSRSANVRDRGAVRATDNARKAVVAVVSGVDIGKRIELDTDREIVIGRNPERCQLVLLNDQSVSREHCRLRFDARQQVFYVMDISANGTFLDNGARLSSGRYYEIRPGSDILLAKNNTRLTLTLSSQGD